MTLTQIRARLAERKARLLELAGSDEDLSEEESAEFSRLTGEVAELSRREAALAASEPEAEPVGAGHVDEDSDAEFAELVARSDIGDIVDAAVFGRAMRGATAELQAEVGAAGNQIPIELFAAATTGADGGPETQETALGQVFMSPLSSQFGVSRMMAPVGQQNVPTVTAPTAGPTAVAADGGTVADSTVTIGAVSLVPKRLQMSATINKTDVVTYRGLGAEVEAVLRAAIQDALDYMVLYGRPGSTDADQAGGGLLNFGNRPTVSTTVLTWKALADGVLSRVDGRFAPRTDDLALALGIKTHTLALTLFRSSETDTNALEYLRRQGVSVMAAGHIAAPASDDQQYLVCRGGSMHTGFVQRLWGPPELIDDNLSLSQDGQRRLTVCLMADGAVARPAMYHRGTAHLA